MGSVQGNQDRKIRANRLILANRFRAQETEPLFGESPYGGLEIANRRFEAIRAKSLARYEISLRIFSGYF